eukprot:9413922-Pyramimonas_sp.AAC.1
MPDGVEVIELSSSDSEEAGERLPGKEAEEVSWAGARVVPAHASCAATSPFVHRHTPHPPGTSPFFHRHTPHLAGTRASNGATPAAAAASTSTAPHRSATAGRQSDWQGRTDPTDDLDQDDFE